MKTLLVVVLLFSGLAGVLIYKFVNKQGGPAVLERTSSVSTPSPSPNDEAQLSAKMKELCDTSGGKVSVAVVHVETGKLSVVEASNELPLFSVYKLPLAIAVLKNIEEGRLKLDQKVHVGAEDVVTGWRGNTLRWKKPVDLTIKQLLELSIVESDNTSAEKLLQLAGGPAVVTDRMRSFDLQQIDIRTTRKEYVATGNPNTGSALGFVKLLSRLQRGELLQPTQTEFLIALMERAKTGLNRLRGNLPSGTRVADKTGSGDPNPKTKLASSTNDVGLIMLPNGRGHLAMAVLLHDSTLADAHQEKLIADLARAAFDAYASVQ